MERCMTHKASLQCYKTYLQCTQNLRVEYSFSIILRVEKYISSNYADYVATMYTWTLSCAGLICNWRWNGVLAHN